MDELILMMILPLLLGFAIGGGFMIAVMLRKMKDEDKDWYDYDEED